MGMRNFEQVKKLKNYLILLIVFIDNIIFDFFMTLPTLFLILGRQQVAS
jgi:hypothetical protein